MTQMILQVGKKARLNYCINDLLLMQRLGAEDNSYLLPELIITLALAGLLLCRGPALTCPIRFMQTNPLLLLTHYSFLDEIREMCFW